MSRGLVLSFLLASCASTGSGPAAVSGWVPFDSQNGDIVFDVRVDGVTTRAILDSGATGSLISKRFCEEHGIRPSGQDVQMQGAFGVRRFDVARPFTIDFGGQNGAPGGAVSIRNAIISERVSDRYDLILGLQFFRELVVQIDYPRRRFRYMTASATNLDKIANSKAKTSPSNRLFVGVEVHGETRWLMFDTGNSSSIYLPRRTAQQEGWIRNSTSAGLVRVAGVVRDVTLERRTVNALKIGPYELEDIPIIVQTIGEETKNRAASELGSHIASNLRSIEPGILGFDVLRHFVVTVDHDAELLHLHLPSQVTAQATGVH